MSFINYVAQEVHCKIIYFGAGLSGKTTNIQYIFDQTQSQSATQGSSLSEDNRETKLITLSSENERTLFFDFLPLSVGEINGYKTRFHLYSVPGQNGQR
jgi:signal recognition particle receptor subunit beta